MHIKHTLIKFSKSNLITDLRLACQRKRSDLSAPSASCVAAWIGSWRGSSRPPCSARRPQPEPWPLDPDAPVGHRKLPDCTALFCVSEALTSPLPSLHHTHKNTCVVSSPSSAFTTRWEREREREREAESSEERTPVELHKVKPRPLEISRWICFLTSLLYHVSGSFTWGKSSLLSTVQVMTSRTLSQSKARVHMAKKWHVYYPDVLSTKLLSLPKLLVFHISCSAAVHPAMQRV